MDLTLKRGDVTSISLPKALKARLDELKDEDQSFAEFLYDLTRPEVIERLERFRGDDDSYGDVIERVVGTSDRSPDELDALLETSENTPKSIQPDRVTVEWSS